MKNIFAILLIIIFSVISIYAGNDLHKINSEKSLDYGIELFNSNDYYRAITEFKRYIFFNKNKYKNSMAQYYIGLSYLSGGELKNAKNVFYTILEDNNNSFVEDAYLRLGDIDMLNSFNTVVEHKYYDFAPSYFNPDNYFMYLKFYKDTGKYSDEAEIKLLFSYMLNCKYGRAKFFADNMQLHTEKYKKLSDEMKKDLYKIKEIPKRSETVAVLLSVLIPGAGQMYAGEVKEGFIALGVNAAFTTLAYLSFVNYSKFLGIWLGYYELTFYFGQISNARHAVYKFNENSKNKLRRYYINLYWKKF